MPKREPYLRPQLAHHVLTKSFVRSWDDGSHAARPSLIELMKDQKGEVDKDVTEVRKCKYEMDMAVTKLREIDQKTNGSVWPVWQCWNFKNEIKQLQDEMRHARDNEMQELVKQHRLAEHNLHEWRAIRDERFEGPAARKVADEIWQQVDHAYDARWVVVKLREGEAERCRDEAKRKHLLTRLATIANVIHWTEYIIGDAEHDHSSIWKRVNGAPSRTPSPPPGLAGEPQLAGHSITLSYRPHDSLPEAPEPPAGSGLERPPSRHGRHEEAESALGKAGRYRMRRRYFGERY
ncbi:hypothetical protein NBRC10512_002475 [Rhodotorula toruloides]